MAILYFNGMEHDHILLFYYQIFANKVPELLQPKVGPQTALILIPLIAGFGRIYQKEFINIKSKTFNI